MGSMQSQTTFTLNNNLLDNNKNASNYNNYHIEAKSVVDRLGVEEETIILTSKATENV